MAIVENLRFKSGLTSRIKHLRVHSEDIPKLVAFYKKQGIEKSYFISDPHIGLWLVPRNPKQPFVTTSVFIELQQYLITSDKQLSP